jgi:metallo-beta-lactamase family protein
MIMQDDATIRFLGAAGTVTGSKHLISVGARRVLLDCGLFQGLKALRERNWASPAFDPATIDAVVLSHAHIDHSGYLPLLVRRGFRGPIFCTPGTADLLHVLLPDAAHLQEEEAEFANRHHVSKHRPALPLFTADDAQAALAQLQPQPYGVSIAVTDGVRARFRRAGHILGSATVDLELGDRHAVRLVFSGDLGRWGRPILRDPELVAAADVLLVESTYGDRLHRTDAIEQLARVVRETDLRRGILIVPAFAVGRTQELIWSLRQLEDQGQIPSLPVFIDSPMAIDVTDIYCRHPEDHNLEMAALMDARRCPLCCKQYHLVRTAAESKALNDRSGPMIIVSASGMATGGRVVHHLKRRLPEERTTVLLTGYQAAGTRGRALQEGATTLRIHGESVGVRARIESIGGLSAHADRGEIFRWLAGFEKPPRSTYVVHGEPHAADQLAAGIRSTLGWTARVAADGETVPVTGT